MTDGMKLHKSHVYKFNAIASLSVFYPVNSSNSSIVDIYNGSAEKEKKEKRNPMWKREN